MMTNELYRLFLDSAGVCTDSRKAGEGQIFFAIKGDTFDGNKFAASAIEAGCKFAVVDNADFAKDERYILVEDALKALQNLSKFHREKFDIPLLAITGSNGKTTTKELVAAILSKKYRLMATRGNLNNHVGLPLTLLELNSQHELAVVEMGANQPGEIGLLSKLAQPSYGIITNIGAAHLEGFGSLEGVKKAKSELYAYLSENGGTGLVNRDNDILMELCKRYPFEAVFYGTKGDLFLRGVKEKSSPFITMTLSGKSMPREINVKTKLTGKYNGENIAAAACAGRYFNIDPFDIKEALEYYEPRNNRSQICRSGSNLLYIDSYNANPVSMKLAIEEFASMEGGPKWLILGDMLELGNYARKEHILILDMLTGYSFKDVLLVGKHFMEHSNDYPFRFFETTKELNEWLRSNKPENSFVLIKGSRGIRLEECLSFL